MMAFYPTNFFPGNHGADDVDENDHHTPGSTSFSSLLPPPPSSCSPQDFHHGISPMLGKRSMSFPGIDVMCNTTIEDPHHQQQHNYQDPDQDNLSDDGSHLLLSGAGDQKKRRLNVEQVKTLEKNFELGNKLEPERKIHLARALGLQPRQVAIWFQNRRARWKTKQLEKDYDILKSQFDNLKADNEALHAQNQKLHSQILTLRGRELPTESINLNKETDQGSCSNTRSSTDNSTASEIKFDISNSTPTPTGSPLSAPPPPTTTSVASMVAFFPPAAVINNDNNDERHHTTPSPSVSTMAQFFHGGQSTSSARQQQHHSDNMMIHHHQVHHHPKEENFTNMFVGIDDQPGFWPWIDQQQHSFN